MTTTNLNVELKYLVIWNTWCSNCSIPRKIGKYHAILWSGFSSYKQTLYWLCKKKSQYLTWWRICLLQWFQKSMDNNDSCEAWCINAHWWTLYNTLRPKQNGRHFADAIFKCIFLNENDCISLKNSLSPINNIPTLVQIMAWRRPGDKPLSEPMMVSFNDAYMRHSASLS